MLDLATLRDDTERVRQALRQRGSDIDLDALLARDVERRALIHKVEGLQAERNEASRKIGAAKRAGEDPAAAMARVREVGDGIKELSAKLAAVEEEIRGELLLIPNVPHESVPVGADDSANREERRWGTPRELAFAARDHVEIAEGLGILDLDRAAKISGARFAAQFGLGARLERALAAYMLDLHAQPVVGVTD